MINDRRYMFRETKLVKETYCIICAWFTLNLNSLTLFRWVSTGCPRGTADHGWQQHTEKEAPLDVTGDRSPDNCVSTVCHYCGPNHPLHHTEWQRWVSAWDSLCCWVTELLATLAAFELIFPLWSIQKWLQKLKFLNWFFFIKMLREIMFYEN